jgi:phage repressor protein C with HTH and peptisase S24 domain
MNTEKADAGHLHKVVGDSGRDMDDLFMAVVSSQIGQRIKEARSAMSQKVLAELIRVHVNTIGKFERGDTVPDAIQLSQIGQATQTNPAWLLCGEIYDKAVPIDGAHLASGTPADLVLVSGYGVKASAGNGDQVNDENVIGRFAFKRSWISRKGLNPNNLVVVTAHGDSMEPTVRDGDILLVDREIGRVASDGIYLIERENDLYCKRLQRRFDGGVTIMSDNPRYEAQHLSVDMAEALHVSGRVIWIGGER